MPRAKRARVDTLSSVEKKEEKSIKHTKRRTGTRYGRELEL
jgi:hypothetical protein